MVEDKKILYLSFGLAGLKGLEKLKELGANSRNLFVITYDLPENQEYLDYLKQNKWNFSLEPIKNEKAFFEIQSFSPEYIVSMHFRDRIPSAILRLAKRGMNLHPSLLPKYAGCLATMWAIIQGEQETGVTYHLLEEEFDTGKILIQKKMIISKSETGESLFYRAIDEGISLFHEALQSLVNGDEGRDQLGVRSYYSRDLPHNGLIDQSWDEPRIERFIRAFNFKGRKPAKLKLKGEMIEIPSFEYYQHILGKS